jgi:hypothetical protein
MQAFFTHYVLYCGEACRYPNDLNQLASPLVGVPNSYQEEMSLNSRRDRT